VVSAKRAALVAANVALLGVLLYVPTLHSPFVYDDVLEIVRNTSIRDLSQIGSVIRGYPTRPLTNLSYAIDFARGGLNPFAYHVTNVLLHAVNVVLVFFLVRLLVIRTRGPSATNTPSAYAIPLLVASLFAVHPVQIEAVTFVSGRAEVLSATFFLASLLCFGYARTAVAIAFFFCALAAKEVAVVLPIIVIAYDWIRPDDDPGGRRRRLWRLYVPLLALVLVVGSVRVWRYVFLERWQSAGVQWLNAFLELHVLQRYISLLFVPRSLSIVPPVASLSSVTDGRVALGALTLLACVGLALFNRRRERLITFGMVWFLIALIPSALIVVLQDAGHPMAEHRLYLPSIGFFLCIGVLADRIAAPGRNRSRTLATAVVCSTFVALLATGTLVRQRVWRTPVLLWEDAAAKSPGNFTAQYGLAEAHRAAADCTNASTAYQRAIAIRPNIPDPYIGYASCLLDQGQRTLARDQLERAMERAPYDVHPRVALAVVEATVFGNAARAAEICRSAVSLAPDDPEATSCLGRTALKTKPTP
jgi:hypothetical protein